ncbi:MAG: hypothetical protein IJH61_04635, partial [Eubacteriaceae bacterium]|nr:hypothetical protein [Eubacteriaceae bacterium]
MVVADISVSKEVQGKLGDGNYEFTYVFAANTSDTYPIVYTKQDGSTVEGTIKGGDTFKLKNHEKAVIKNVVYNTSYSITEKGTNDYRASVSYKGADNRTATASASALRTNPNDVSVGTKVITVTGEEKYEYTNVKDELVPAGINEILLPFALLVFLALIAAVTYVFATKKKTNK